MPGWVSEVQGLHTCVGAVPQASDVRYGVSPGGKGCSGCAVVAVRLSRAGLPLAVLSDSTAHALHLGMRAWMRVADSAFALSSYLSMLNPSAAAPGQAVL